jgi:hypothetical protein
MRKGSVQLDVVMYVRYLRVKSKVFTVTSHYYDSIRLSVKHPHDED